MSGFSRITAIAAPVDGLNIDTDQIVPARFLKFDRAAGYGKFLFHDLRFDASDAEQPEFVLNREPFRAAGILVTDENFGCGSSREGAVYALHDFGVRVVIAPSFGDIFYNNYLRNGLLPAKVSIDAAAELRRSLSSSADPRLTVDLETLQIQTAAGQVVSFALDEFWRECLLQGVDELGLALQQEPRIEAFERDYFRAVPWLA